MKSLIRAVRLCSHDVHGFPTSLSPAVTHKAAALGTFVNLGATYELQKAVRTPSIIFFVIALVT
jgi:hypothetical protein